ncbi:hypothetical protein ACSZNJ_18575 [Aeromonas hydrophila]|uniref:hypothetical protein n=1 Tax=Aeromonas hydrophila TaxID=644 RepID=UPI00111A4AF9|nr:hypothetical protein [Aeromonas hydrophila]
MLRVLALLLREIFGNLLEYRFKLERTLDATCGLPDFHDSDYCNFQCAPNEELFSVACKIAGV